jgi:hypothetical protein
MKRLTIGLVTAMLALGSLAPSANAWHRHDSYRHSDRCYTDPVARALAACNRVLLNNYFDGYRYRSAGAWLSPHEVRYVGRTWGGGYRIWFQGTIYTAYLKTYRGKLCLYLGSAPTHAGYRFELVLG